MQPQDGEPNLFELFTSRVLISRSPLELSLPGGQGSCPKDSWALSVEGLSLEMAHPARGNSDGHALAQLSSTPNIVVKGAVVEASMPRGVCSIPIAEFVRSDIAQYAPQRQRSVFLGNLRFGMAPADIAATLSRVCDVSVGASDVQFHYFHNGATPNSRCVNEAAPPSKPRGSATLWVRDVADQHALVAYHSRIYFTEDAVLVGETPEALTAHMVSPTFRRDPDGPKRTIVIELPRPQSSKRHAPAPALGLQTLPQLPLPAMMSNAPMVSQPAHQPVQTVYVMMQVPMLTQNVFPSQLMNQTVFAPQQAFYQHAPQYYPFPKGMSGQYCAWDANTL